MCSFAGKRDPKIENQREDVQEELMEILTASRRSLNVA